MTTVGPWDDVAERYNSGWVESGVGPFGGFGQSAAVRTLGWWCRMELRDIIVVSCSQTLLFPFTLDGGKKKGLVKLLCITLDADSAIIMTR